MAGYISSFFGKKSPASVASMPVNAAAAAAAAAAAKKNANNAAARNAAARNAAAAERQAAHNAAARNAAAARRTAYLALLKEARYRMCYDMKGRSGMNKSQAEYLCEQQTEDEEAEKAAASNPVLPGAVGPLPSSGGNRKRKSTRKVQRKKARKTRRN